MAHCYMFSIDKFVWVDETGSDRRDQLHKYGYSLIGDRAVQHKFLTRGTRINVIAALCHEGLVAMEPTKSTVNRAIFFNFLRTKLIPNMMQFDGYNPHSVVIMDNLSVHHVEEVIDLFHDTGILISLIPTPIQP